MTKYLGLEISPHLDQCFFVPRCSVQNVLLMLCNCSATTFQCALLVIWFVNDHLLCFIKWQECTVELEPATFYQVKSCTLPMHFLLCLSCWTMKALSKPNILWIYNYQWLCMFVRHIDLIGECIWFTSHAMLQPCCKLAARSVHTISRFALAMIALSVSDKREV